MNCKSCGGSLKFENGIYICENCRLQQSISAFFENTEVFMCYMETDSQGRRSRDSVIAQDLYNKLENAKIHTFYQRISTDGLSENDFETANTIAYDKAKIIAVIATTQDNFQKLCEKYRERFGAKKVIPIYSGMNANDITPELKSLQAVNYDTVGAAADFVKNILRLLGREQEINITETAQKHMSRKKKMTVMFAIAVAALLVASASYIVFGTPYILKSKKYEYAENLQAQNCYLEAIDLYSSLGNYKNASNLLDQIYNVYDGYYTKESEMVSLQLNIDKNYNAEISVIHIIDGNRFMINATATINQNYIEFSFIDTKNDTGRSIIQLENDGLSLNIKMDDESQSAQNLNIKFGFAEKTDVPILKEIDTATVHQWLSTPKHESDFINAGYNLSVYDNVYKSGALIKKIANYEMYLAVFNDLYLKMNGPFIEYQHLDDGAVLAFQGPASIICPEYIGKELEPIITENIVYMPEGGFFDMDGKLSFYRDGTLNYELIAKNKSTNGLINDNTIVSVTSEQLVGEENWNDIMRDFGYEVRN